MSSRKLYLALKSFRHYQIYQSVYLWSDVILQFHYVIFHITRLQEILREVKMGCLHTSAFQVLHRNKIYVLYLLLQMLSTVLNGKKRDCIQKIHCSWRID